MTELIELSKSWYAIKIEVVPNEHKKIIIFLYPH